MTTMTRFAARRIADAPVGQAILSGWYVIDSQQQYGQIPCRTPEEARRIAALSNSRHPLDAKRRQMEAWELPGEPL